MWMPNDVTGSAPPIRWLGLPAWLFSLAVHLTVVVLGVLFFRLSPPTKGFDEQDRPAAIVLVKREAGQTNYFDEESSAAPAAQAARSAAAAAPSAGDPLTGTAAPPGVPGMALPQLPGNLASGQSLVPAIEPSSGQGRTKLPFAIIDEAAVLAADALVPDEVQPTGPTAKLSLFGSAQAEGWSFVFVIDRSQS